MRRGGIRKHVATAHVLLYTELCINCGKCVSACPKGVLDQVNLIVHKHAHVGRADLCVGCLKCAKACQQNAIVPVGSMKPLGDSAFVE